MKVSHVSLISIVTAAVFSLSFIIVSGCAGSGHGKEFNTQATSQVKPGMTEEDVIHIMGSQPAQVQTGQNAEGTWKTLIYSYAPGTNMFESIAGAYGKNNTDKIMGQSFVVTLANGKVKSTSGNVSPPQTPAK